MNKSRRTSNTHYAKGKYWAAISLLSLVYSAAALNGATPIITAPPGDLQVDVGATLTFSEGTITTFVGQDTNGYTDGTGTAAQFSTDVQGMDFDVTGNLYVSDTSNNRIRKVTSAGVVTTHIGDGTAGSVNGTGVSAQINSLKDLIYTNSGTIYFADSGNNRIRQFDAGANVANFIGKKYCRRCCR